MSLLTNINIGRYYHHNSLVHRLDPRTKLFALLLLIVSVFLAGNLWSGLFLASFLIAAILLSRVPLRLVLSGLRPMLWIFASILALHIFFTDGSSNPLFTLGPVTATWEGVQNGTRASCRFLLIVMGAGVLTLTTAPLQLADSVAKALRPLRRVGLPLHQLPIMMMIVLHFIPVLFGEAGKLISAQKARGAQLERRNMLKRLKALVPILAALLRSSFRKADKLAVGIESRCYRGGSRSHLHEIGFVWSDGIALALAVAMPVVTLAIDRAACLPSAF